MKISEHFDNKQVSRVNSYNMGDIKSFISIYVGSKNTNINSWAKRLVYNFREKIEDSDKREELIEMGIY